MLSFEPFSKISQYLDGSFLLLPSSSYRTFAEAGEENNQNDPMTKKDLIRIENIGREIYAFTKMEILFLMEIEMSSFCLTQEYVKSERLCKLVLR